MPAVEYHTAAVVVVVGAACVAAAMAWGKRTWAGAGPAECKTGPQAAACVLSKAVAAARAANNNKPVPPFRADVVDAALADLAASTDASTAVAAEAKAILEKAKKDGAAIEARRKASYDDDERNNEPLLRELWAAAGLPPKDFARRSGEWSKLGFQGQDPTTDLRGGGALALDFLVHLARADQGLLRGMVDFNVKQLADGDMSWFLTAVVSIQFSTRLALGEVPLTAAHLEFALGDGAGVQRGLMRTHAAMMRQFFAVWREKHPSVMEYTQFVEPNFIEPFFREAPATWYLIEKRDQ